LGGSRFQIAGPTGAFVPILFSIVIVHGYAGLALATIMAGAMLVIAGALRMGGLLKFFPYPVVAGFTSGIAVIIFCGQLNEFLGLGLKMPEHAPQQVAVLFQHFGGVNGWSVALGALTVAIVYLWPRIDRRIPASIVAVGSAAIIAHLAHLPVATIASRYGGIPAGLPGLYFPMPTLDLIRAPMGPGLTIAAPGAI